MAEERAARPHQVQGGRLDLTSTPREKKEAGPLGVLTALLPMQETFVTRSGVGRGRQPEQGQGVLLRVLALVQVPLPHGAGAGGPLGGHDGVGPGRQHPWGASLWALARRPACLLR